MRNTPEGQVDRIIAMPIERPTKPMFGDASLDALIVTSVSAGARDDPRQPDAGSLFAVTSLGVSGVPQARFAG
ncbi:MAG: hypothetical protein GY788_27600 [bacterium]|nr:hypothetical protein [bacterium]